MSQITRCPSCATAFKVVADQLRISDGWVRCGQCKEVFDASASLLSAEPAPLLPDLPLPDVAPPSPAVWTTRSTPHVQPWGTPEVSSAASPAASPADASPAAIVAPGSSVLEASAPGAAPAVASAFDALTWPPGPPPAPVAPTAPVLDIPGSVVPSFLSVQSAGDAGGAAERELVQAPTAPFAWRAPPPAATGRDAEGKLPLFRSAAVPAAFIWQTESSLPPAVPAAVDSPHAEPQRAVDVDAAPEAAQESPSASASESVSAREQGSVAGVVFEIEPVTAEHSMAWPEPDSALDCESVHDPMHPSVLAAEDALLAQLAGDDRDHQGEEVLPQLEEDDSAAQQPTSASVGGPLASPLNSFADEALLLSVAIDEHPAVQASGNTVADEPVQAQPVEPGEESLAPVEEPECEALPEGGPEPELEAVAAVESTPAPAPTESVQAPESATKDDAEDNDAADVDAGQEVSFVVAARRKAFWQRPAVRIVLWLTIALACAGVALQWVVHERNRIAAFDARTKPWLAQLCVPLQCELSSQRQIADVVIDSSSFNRARGDSYVLNLTLKNQAAIALAMPAIELTLTDAQDQPVLRRVLLPGDMAAAAELPARGEWHAAVSVIVTTGGARVAGYRLLAFYP